MPFKYRGSSAVKKSDTVHKSLLPVKIQNIKQFTAEGADVQKYFFADADD